MRWLFALLLLTACASDPAEDQAFINSHANQIVTNCRAQTATNADRVRCVSRNMHNFYRDVGYPHLDIYDAQQAQILVLAEKLDREQITEDEYRAGIQALVSQSVSSADSRNTNAAIRYRAYKPTYCWPIGATMICQ